MTNVHASDELAPVDSMSSPEIYDPAPVFVSNGVIYSAVHNKLFAIDARTSHQLWAITVDSENILMQPQVVGNTIYISAEHANIHTVAKQSSTSSLFAFAAQNGQKQWEHDFQSAYVSSPTVSNSLWNALKRLDRA